MTANPGFAQQAASGDESGQLCIKCGVRNHADATFCVSCGNRIC
ncbi:hypothetical protein [Nocardioides jensenii]|nr:hypothetical protein [Nocardioides jensenii]